MLQNNAPKTDFEEKQMIQTLADVCQGLISILPINDAPYGIVVENEDGVLTVSIDGKTGPKLLTSLKVSKMNGEEFVNAFRDYFIRERDIYISYFSRINHDQLRKYKYDKLHPEVDEEIARTHVIHNHMYRFTVNRYYGLDASDLAAHDNAINKMNIGNKKLMKIKVNEFNSQK